ncbi:MAG: chromate resistance protein [Devosia indica]
MPAPDAIAPDKLAKLVGTPKSPIIVDLRHEDDFARQPRLIPAAKWYASDALPEASAFSGGRSIVTVCGTGSAVSQGVAATLRAQGIAAEYLEGGYAAWIAAGLPTFDPAKLPPADSQRATHWVTRSRPKIDRIACPWLVRRFIDPDARFLFVAPSEVVRVGELFSAAPYDIEGVFWSHRGEDCTFDVMIAEFGLAIPALDRLARIIRGADTARLDLEPEAAGLLAASLGLSRMYSDDREQLEAGMLLYDALFRWARDATGETHNWPTNKGPAQ